jgi:hypothetical protein
MPVQHVGQTLRYLFVGERWSEQAHRIGAGLAEGRLAGKHLFDALWVNGVDPATCQFANWFVRQDRGQIYDSYRDGWTIFALGQIVVKALTKHHIPHIPTVHPSARDFVRKPHLYHQEVGRALRCAAGNVTASPAPTRVKHFQIKDAAERFWSRVNKTDTCWIWTGRTQAPPNLPYGMISWNGKERSTHRLSYELEYGPIGNRRILVLHKCDNPRCVRPAHLFLGSHQDNATDRDQKGRFRVLHGSLNGWSKLTEKDVASIIKTYDDPHSKETGVDIAKRFGVSPTTVHDILRGKTWRHVKITRRTNLAKLKTFGTYNVNNKLTEDQVRQIRLKWASGAVTQQALAEEYNICRGLIYKIATRKSWGWLV